MSYNCPKSLDELELADLSEFITCEDDLKALLKAVESTSGGYKDERN